MAAQALVAARPRWWAEENTPEPQAVPSPWLITGLLALIISVAAVLRLYRLDTFPPGLYGDIAANGLDALRSLQHGFSALYPRGLNNADEGMLVWIDALSLLIFGVHPLALYVTTVAIGLITLPVQFFLAKRLFGWRVGLISTALLAVSFWDVHYSRLGYRNILLPLFVDLVFLCLTWAIARGGVVRWGLSGALVGLTAYTYTGARVFPLLLVACAVLYWRDRRSLPGSPLELRVFAGSATFFALPLLLAIGTNPGSLWHMEGVSVVSGPIALLPVRLFDHALETVAAFNLLGDPEAQYNLPNLPLFDPLVGLAFLAGIKFAWDRRGPGLNAYSLVLLWLAIFTLPVLLSDRTPHMLRGAGMIPAAYMLAALGVDRILSRYRPRFYRPAALVIVGLSLAWTSVLYFGVYPRVPGLYHTFMGDKADLGRFISNSDWGGRPLYVMLTWRGQNDPFQAKTVRFQSEGTAWSLLPPDQVERLSDHRPLVVILAPSDRDAIEDLNARFAGSRIYMLRLRDGRLYDVFVSPGPPVRLAAIAPYTNT